MSRAPMPRRGRRRRRQRSLTRPASTAKARCREGPVSDGPHEWSDGLAAEIVAVGTGPAQTVDDPALDTEVRVTVELTNTGSDVVSFGTDPNGLDAGPDDELFYGVNRACPVW